MDLYSLGVDGEFAVPSRDFCILGFMGSLHFRRETVALGVKHRGRGIDAAGDIEIQLIETRWNDMKWHECSELNYVLEGGVASEEDSGVVYEAEFTHTYIGSRLRIVLKVEEGHGWA